MRNNNKNRITDITVGLAIVIGITINQCLASLASLTLIPNLIITFALSAIIHEVVFMLLTKMINHSEFLLKIFLGKTFIKGYWSYTYILNGERKYGAWCIEQNIDTITIKGFGITADGARRSDVQSLTPLIARGNDYEVVNMRKDISSDGTMPDTFYYSKTTLHFQQRDTFFNVFNYPLMMDGSTFIYGGVLSGSVHSQLIFKKHLEAKCENDIEKIVKNMIS